MFKIEGLYLDFSPSLLEIAQSIKNYDLAKLIINRKGYEAELAKVEDHYCKMATLVEEKNPVILQALFSNPNIIVPEQYQFLIFL